MGVMCGCSSGSCSGNSSGRASTQSTRQSMSVSSLTIARPTWPAPCSCRGKRGGGSVQPSSASRVRWESRSFTRPPQHWPSAGPSGRSSSWGGASGRASLCRAASIAFHSRWPPPMVPSTSTGVTSMRVPVSRGAEPWCAAISTSTTGVPPSSRARAAACRRSMIIRAAPPPARPGSPPRSPAPAAADRRGARPPPTPHPGSPGRR